MVTERLAAPPCFLMDSDPTSEASFAPSQCFYLLSMGRWCFLIGMKQNIISRFPSKPSSSIQPWGIQPGCPYSSEKAVLSFLVLHALSGMDLHTRGLN